MHLGTALLLLESVLVLVAEVTRVFTTAMTLHGTAGTADTTGGIQERVKDVEDLKGANEIIEKIERTLREQLSRRGDNHIRPAAATSIDSPTDPTGSFSGAHLKSATEKKAAKSKHLRPPQSSFSPPADANIHRTNVHAPKYMLDLYDKFSTDKYSHPMANIVRSFMNINEEANDVIAADVGTGSAVSNSSRVHRLLFNVTSIGRDEEIYIAELRLFTLVEADRLLYDGINRKVTVSEVIASSSSIPGAPPADDGNRRLELIDSKVIYGRHSGWETITVTDAVRRWVKQRPQGDSRMLQVRIETVGRLRDESSSGSSSSSGIRDAAVPPPPMVDINSRPNNENEPLLLVFSNDRRRHSSVYETNELNEIVEEEDEADGGGLNANHPNSGTDADYAYYDEEVVYEYEDDVAADRRRKRRNAPTDRNTTTTSFQARKQAGRASRVVRVTEEGEQWDVDALSFADDGGMSYPVEIARRLRKAHKDEARTPEADDDNDDEVQEEDNDKDDDDVGNEENSFRYETTPRNVGRRSEGERRRVRRSEGERRRVRRSGRRRLRRNSCHRVPMFVNFEDIQWQNWILKPFGYQAFECQGRCYLPLDDRLTPTKHAIIQTLLNAHYPKKASETCCVPTKLEPISILYVDDQGIVTYKYKYDGMVVAECGCR